MAVNIGKLWDTKDFMYLSNHSKLLYIYLVSDLNLDVVGVTNFNITLAMVHLNIGIDELRNCTNELKDKNFIHVKKFGEDIFVVIPAHFPTIPKSQQAAERVKKALGELPDKLVEFLSTLGVTLDRKVVKFTEPTYEEVTKYCLSMGYSIDVQYMIDYYRGKAELYNRPGLWVDGKGKTVKDWKGKLRQVWFKEERKMKAVDGAPKGFEYFNIEFEGKTAFPDSWKNGLPQSTNFAVTKALQREYEKRKKS